jgi:hypothetical protein
VIAAFVMTTNLILADYLVAFGNFTLSVGKAVPVANAMPFIMRR